MPHIHSHNQGQSKVQHHVGAENIFADLLPEETKEDLVH